VAAGLILGRAVAGDWPAGAGAAGHAYLAIAAFALVWKGWWS
jgi:hypothetical protein